MSILTLNTNGWLVGGIGGIASGDDPGTTVAAALDVQMEIPA
jgi:hypothetical protein